MEKIRKISLQLFAEGAEGAAENGAAEAAAEEAVAGETAEAGSQERIAALEQRLEEVLKQLQPAQAPRQEPDAGLVQRHWQGVEQIYRQLTGQAEELKQLYPDFDLSAELRDGRFAGMLRAGVDMQTAFQAIHAREILPAAMEYAARTVQERMAGAMLTGANRPTENGLRSGGAVMIGSQVGRMSRQDYDRICRLVERGERVSFG